MSREQLGPSQRPLTRGQFLRLGAAAGAGMSFAGLIAACGGDGETVSEGAGKAPAAGQKLGGALTATYMRSGTYDVAAKELATSFEREFGTNVKIAAFPYVTLLRNNQNDLLTGAGNYDLLSAVAAPMWSNLVPLESYMQRDGYDPPFVSGLLDKVPRSEGKLVGLPYSADAYGLAVRTDLFEEAGIDLPDEAWTWDEFDAVLAELDGRFKSRGLSAFVLAGGAVDQLAPFFWGRYDGYHIDPQGKMAHDPAKSVAAIERLQRHLDVGPEGVRGLSIDAANAVFLGGDACIMECWPSFTRTALEDPKQSNVKGKWAFVPYPTPGFDYMALWHLAISSATEHEEAAWQWIKHFINQENDKQFFEDYGFGLVMQPSYEDSGLLNKHSNDFPATEANLGRAQMPVVTDEAEAFLGQTVSEVISGQASPDEGIAKVNEKWGTLKPAAAEVELARRQGLVQS
jgi:multiple sugar transport system substrate-binding protein